MSEHPEHPEPEIDATPIQVGLLAPVRLELVNRDGMRTLMVQLRVDKLYRHDAANQAAHPTTGTVDIAVWYKDSPEPRGICQEFRGKTQKGFIVSLYVPLAEGELIMLEILKIAPENALDIFEIAFEGYLFCNDISGPVVEQIRAPLDLQT